MHTCSSFEQRSCAGYNPNTALKQALWLFRLAAEGWPAQPLLNMKRRLQVEKYNQSSTDFRLLKNCWPRDLPCSPLLNSSFSSTEHIDWEPSPVLRSPCCLPTRHLGSRIERDAVFQNSFAGISSIQSPGWLESAHCLGSARNSGQIFDVHFLWVRLSFPLHILLLNVGLAKGGMKLFFSKPSCCSGKEVAAQLWEKRPRGKIPNLYFRYLHGLISTSVGSH